LKKLLILLTLVVAVVAFSTVSHAAFDGSAHDFSGAAWITTLSTGAGTKCGACHTPHNPPTDTNYEVGTNAPLWNHFGDTGRNYTLYSGSSGVVGAMSVVCLSCHDGVTGLDAFGGGAGNDANNMETLSLSNAGALVGLDLQDDHPVHVTVPNTSEYASVASDGNGVRTYDTGGTEYVECASCHDPHDTDTGNGMFMKVENGDSTLCTTCHTK
jgi:predicted CXXCH cytochrome family protein